MRAPSNMVVIIDKALALFPTEKRECLRANWDHTIESIRFMVADMTATAANIETKIESYRAARRLIEGDVPRNHFALLAIDVRIADLERDLEQTAAWRRRPTRQPNLTIGIVAWIAFRMLVDHGVANYKSTCCLTGLLNEAVKGNAVTADLEWDNQTTITNAVDKMHAFRRWPSAPPVRGEYSRDWLEPVHLSGNEKDPEDIPGP
jgi:hypothetical protein